MNFRAGWIFVVLISITLCACSGEPIEPAGQGDYATLITLGNSLTAGYLNGALVEGGQRAGYANLMSRAINGRDLSMPLVCDCEGNRGIGLPSADAPTVVPGMLYVDPTTMSVTQDPLSINPQSMLKNLTHVLPYENLGIPFAFTWDVLNATSADSSFGGVFAGRPNLFVDMVLRNSFLAGKNTILEQTEHLAGANYATPTVLSLWIGNNDILIGSVSGEPQLGDNITPSTVFGGLMQLISARLAAADFSQVVIGNIPDIGSVPFFTTISPIAPVPLKGEGEVILWNTEETNVVRVLLPAQTLLFTSEGLPNPDYLPGGGSMIPATLTLDAGEVQLLEESVDAYNAIIAQLATDKGWALADVHALLAGLSNDPQNPATFGEINAVFALLPGFRNTNAAFSLDGVHPSEKGAALVAGTFLDALNTTYGTSYVAPDADAVTNVLGFEQLDALAAMPTQWKLSELGAQALLNMAGRSGLARVIH